MKKSTVMKLIVSMLCVTMFTACGKRDSKKRNTGIYQGAKQEQPAQGNGAPAVEGEDISNTSGDEPEQETLTDNEGNPLDIEPAQEGSEGTDTTVNTPDNTNNETNNDRPIVVSEPTQSTPSTGGSTHTNTNETVPVEKVTPSNKTASNKPTRKDPLSGLGFFEDTPYNSQFAINEMTHTGYSTLKDTPNEGTALDYTYTDLVSDNVMYKLKNLFDADINTYSSENELFAAQSIELSQAINRVYSNVVIAKQTINVNIKIGQKGNVFENNTLEFFGSLREDGTARLSPTQNSSNYNYILDVVCLDKTTSHCQTQQLILSYYYKKDDVHGKYKKGSLCKRAYMVNRLGHASMNINSKVGDNRTDYIDYYVTNPKTAQSHICSTEHFNHYANAVICLADFTYNSLYRSLHASCEKQGPNAECKKKFTNMPMGRFAKKVYLHTFAVAQGKSQYTMSLQDSDNKYMSFDGDLIDTTNATRANIGSMTVERQVKSPSFLASHINDDGDSYGLLLNGIDSQSVMQFKLTYNEMKKNYTEEERQSAMTTDIIQRFPDLNLSQFRTNFPAPVESEMDDIKEDRDDNKDDDYSMKDKIKDKLKKIFKDDTLKVKAIDYTCDELKTIVNENKTVHIYGKVWKFNSSRVVHSKESVCEYKRDMGYEYSAERSNWKTSDEKYCHVGYFCQQKSSN